MIAVMGPTASGKTDIAEALADRLNAQLINADAFQVYVGLDIGTAKPENRQLYELIDLVSPTEQFGVGEWVRRSSEILGTLFQQQKSAVIVGGTGLYVRALFQEFLDMSPPPDPKLREQLNQKLESEGLPALVQELREIDAERASKVDLLNPVRVIRALEKSHSPSSETVQFSLPPYLKAKLARIPTLEETETRISARLDAMITAGFLEEVARLREEGIPFDAPGMRAIGYRTMWHVLEGSIGKEEAIERIRVETRQYAKRQRTWLRSEPDLQIIGLDRDDFVAKAMSDLMSLRTGD